MLIENWLLTSIFGEISFFVLLLPLKISVLHYLSIDWQLKFQFYLMCKPVQLIFKALSNFPSGSNSEWKNFQFKKLYLSSDLPKKEFKYNAITCGLLFFKSFLPIFESSCWLWKLIALDIWKWEWKKGRCWRAGIRICLQDEQWQGCV